MQVEESIKCPYCGQDSTVMIDASQGSQNFVTDCEVCCRPMEVQAECEDGKVVSLDVAAG